MRKLFFCIFLCLTSTLLGGVVDDGLKKVTLNDQLLMRYFFETNLRMHQAAHVIYFDNKPVCLATAWVKSSQRLFKDVLWIKGWQAFRRNEHLFPHSNFIFASEIDGGDACGQSLSLFIINRKAVTDCLDKHVCIFREKLGSGFSREEFILALENGVALTSLIQNDEMLLGILLGFGEESCRKYQEMRSGYKGTTPPHTQEYCPLEIRSPNIKKLFPVGFMGNPQSEEVQYLMAEYERELNIFWDIYKKEDPLVLFLKCICGEAL